MDLRRIEAWALEVIDRVSKGTPNEDTRVELKSGWPDDFEKTARRVAGHANAARGEPILWLLGVHPTLGVQGVAERNLADWYKQVAAEFDGLAPPIVDLNLTVDGKTVVALLFETDRAPFVIRNPAYGKEQTPVAREVPYREGTAVRSATRNDLLRLLMSSAVLPDVELLEAKLLISPPGRIVDGVAYSTLELELTIYESPISLDKPVVIPFHRCTGTVEIPNYIPATPLGIFVRHASGTAIAAIRTSDVVGTQHEITIRAAAMLEVFGTAYLRDLDAPKEDASLATASVNLHVLGASSSLAFEIRLHRVEPTAGEWGGWVLKEHDRPAHNPRTAG